MVLRISVYEGFGNNDYKMLEKGNRIVSLLDASLDFISVEPEGYYINIPRSNNTSQKVICKFDDSKFHMFCHRREAECAIFLEEPG